MNKEYLKTVLETIAINMSQLNFLIKQNHSITEIDDKMDEIKENLRIIHSGIDRI